MEKKYKELQSAGDNIVNSIPYKPFPSPIGAAHTQQDQHTNSFLPVHKGYLAYLVMEKLPGKRVEPDEFWARNQYRDSKWDKPRRAKFRTAMAKAAGYDSDPNSHTHFDITLRYEC
jgi:hypothetical protein